jgi:hypothetical protein
VSDSQNAWAGAAAVGYVVVVTALLVAATRADRFPLEPVTAAIALVAPPLGAGALGRSWWLLGLVPLPAGIGFGLAAVSSNPFVPLAYGALLALAALMLIPVGVAVGRRVDHGRLPLLAAAAIAAGLLVVPVSVLQRHRTVDVDRADPVPVDEGAGTFRGVGLGDTLTQVRKRLGAGERVLPNDPRSRGVGPEGVTTGPSFLPTGGDELRYGRDLSFLLDEDRRVEYVEIADRRAQTRAGVGPGDSLELFGKAYPEMRCDEGSAGSDAPIPYPQCTVQIGGRRWLYVGGTYDLPGEPAVVLILSRRRVG